MNQALNADCGMEQNWRPATDSKQRIHFGGWALVLPALTYAVVALILPYDGRAPDNFSTWGIHLAAFAGPLVVSFLATTRYTKSL